jgi:hypothetical protein
MAGAEDILAITGLFATVSMVVWTSAKVYLRKLELEHRDSSPQLHGATQQRLERIEQAVESIAIEVERISEGQRFTTKLLAERTAAPPPAADDPGPR